MPGDDVAGGDVPAAVADVPQRERPFLDVHLAAGQHHLLAARGASLVRLGRKARLELARDVVEELGLGRAERQRQARARAVDVHDQRRRRVADLVQHRRRPVGVRQPAADRARLVVHADRIDDVDQLAPVAQLRDERAEIHDGPARISLSVTALRYGTRFGMSIAAARMTPGALAHEPRARPVPSSGGIASPRRRGGTLG
jgi:hypothetical protein